MKDSTSNLSISSYILLCRSMGIYFDNSEYIMCSCYLDSDFCPNLFTMYYVTMADLVNAVGSFKKLNEHTVVSGRFAFSRSYKRS